MTVPMSMPVFVAMFLLVFVVFMRFGQVQLELALNVRSAFVQSARLPTHLAPFQRETGLAEKRIQILLTEPITMMHASFLNKPYHSASHTRTHSRAHTFSSTCLWNWSLPSCFLKS